MCARAQLARGDNSVIVGLNHLASKTPQYLNEMLQYFTAESRYGVLDELLLITAILSKDGL
jgi:hypothetical protein